MRAEDGKMRMTDVANTEQMFRLIQSIPSPKAKSGGSVAKAARKQLESQLGRSVISSNKASDYIAPTKDAEVMEQI